MEEIHITVDGGAARKKQGDLFGAFFEDLSHAADGGLYGELVRNRSFEFDRVDNEGYHSMMAWRPETRGDSVVQAHVETAEPLSSRNPHYLVLEILAPGEGGGISNEGYAPGIPAKEGKTYFFSCWYRLRRGKEIPLEVRLESGDGRKCLARREVVLNSGEWQKRELELTAEGTERGCRLVLLVKEEARVELDMISLFPADTFLPGKCSLRRDIAEMIRDMKPRFLRFPGGCLTHIGSLDAGDRSGMYRWKNTIGPVEERPSRRNSWNYNQTFGLGFYEFFLFCEEIGAEPLPVLSAGYDPHHLRMASLDEMQEWIDDALDLIEFANGDRDTGWGAVRAGMGHPEIFHLKYLAIGNEEVGDAYFERYERILEAVKKRWPQIQLINSAGPGCGGSEFEKGWNQASRTDTAYVDEHFYQSPDWFVANAHRYEAYPEEPKAFLGEYASHDDTWYNALAEAAFMTGMEKSKGLGLACYAPLLCHVNYRNWTPVLLYFDDIHVYGSPSYYVQKLFMHYQGEELLGVANDNCGSGGEESEPQEEVKAAEAKVFGGTDEPVLQGAVAMSTGGAEVEVSDFQIMDIRSGRTVKVPDFRMSPEVSRQECGKADSAAYEISFTFCKKNGGREGNLNGRYSFSLEFAVRDDGNKLRWTIDGWQRLTSLKGLYRGSDSDMGGYLFASEKDRTYRARLSVEGNHVRTYIDGKEYCEHTFCMPKPERLYNSAVRDRDGNIIVKAVNLEEEEKLVHISLPDEKRWDRVEIQAMEGFGPKDRNSFDEPEKVVPTRKFGTVEKNHFAYLVPGMSMDVFIFQGREAAEEGI